MWTVRHLFIRQFAFVSVVLSAFNLRLEMLPSVFLPGFPRLTGNLECPRPPRLVTICVSPPGFCSVCSPSPLLGCEDGFRVSGFSGLSGVPLAILFQKQQGSRSCGPSGAERVFAEALS